jgi:m7GpppX diphosphatase
LRVEKTAFSDELPSITNETQSPNVSLLGGNDIYRWYLASMSQENFSMKMTMIYPATDVHIRKYEKQKRRMVKETPEIYREHIEGYIQTMKGSRIQWYICLSASLTQAIQYYRSQSGNRENNI